MGTAIVCFVFAGLSLLPLVSIGRLEGDGATKLLAAMPFVGSASIWLLAGMLFVWFQRLHDAIVNHGSEVGRLLREIKADGLDVRATTRKTPPPPTPPQLKPQQSPTDNSAMPWLNEGN